MGVHLVVLQYDKLWGLSPRVLTLLLAGISNSEKGRLGTLRPVIIVAFVYIVCVVLHVQELPSASFS